MKKDIEFLKNSLIYQMSLGSKELFHSNIWAWLIRNDKSFINVFFDDIFVDDYKIDAISREEKNRDIIIKIQNNNVNKKYYLLIENKIKSLPDQKQLEEYTKLDKIGDYHLLKAVYTGINDNLLNEEKTFNKISWKFVSYGEIQERIQKILEKSTKFNNEDNKTKQDQIQEYSKVLECINNIINNELIKKEKILDYDFETNSDENSFLRIKDILIKLKGADFFNYVKKRKNELDKLVPNGYILEMNQSFFNNNACLDFRFTNWKEGCKKYGVVGVQIQGDQYRLIAQRDKGTSSCEQVFEEFKKYGWFEQYNKEVKKIHGKISSMRDSKAQYGNNEKSDYSFVYQYYNISNEDNNYEDIYKCIQDDLKKANEIIEKNAIT